MLLLWVALGSLACALVIAASPATEDLAPARGVLLGLSLSVAFVFLLGWCYWLAVH